MPQGSPVVDNFFGGRAFIVFNSDCLKEFIMGGDDIFDLRAVFSLIDQHGIDQDVFVGDHVCVTLKL